MFKLHSLGLKNIVYFKDTKVRLDKHPLTFVRGVNKDADPLDPTSNGVGKSLLFSCPPNIFYFSPPAASRKNSKKDLLKKDSINSIRFTDPKGIKYEISQKAKGYTIVENGVDLQFKRIPEAEKFIRKIFPLLEIDYYSYGYVSTQRPYQLQSDTNLARLDHLTAIFRLDSYDLMRAHFVKQLSTVKSNEVKLSVLEQKALEQKVRLKKIKGQQAGLGPKNIKTLKLRQKTLSSELDALNKEEYRLNSEVSTLTTLRRIEKELDTLRGEYRFKVKPSKMYHTLVAERKIVRALDRYTEALKAYTSSVSTLEKKLSKIKLPAASKKEIDERLETVTKKLRKEQRNLDGLVDRDREYRQQERLVTSLTKEYEELGIPKGTDLDRDWGTELAQCMSALKLNSLLEHEHLDTKNNSCPVCLSEIDLASIRQVVKDARKRLPKLKALTKAKNLKVQINKESLKVSHTDRTSLENELVCLRAFIKSVTDSKAEYQSQLSLIEENREIEKELSKIAKPKNPEARPSLGYNLEELDHQIELCSDILKHLEAKERLLENDPSLTECRTVKSVEAAISDKGKALTKLAKTIRSTRNDLAGVSQDLEAANQVSAELGLLQESLSALSSEIEELRPGVEDKSILETLVKAYSTKGLKTLRANEVCSLLETNLNHYRHLTFAEAFSFSVKASETGLAILVDRGNGVVSDVRLLSGAESNSFRLLFLLSLLVLIPDERRLNTVVLDEPCSHSDSVSRAIFLDKYLPALQEIVPHIYVVTPHRSDQAKGGVDLIVKKEQGVSTVHKNYLNL